MSHNTQEELAQNLHKWYLEACQLPESGMDYNILAQEPYEALKETQKFLDRYIAGKTLDYLCSSLIEELEEKKRTDDTQMNDDHMYDEGISDAQILIKAKMENK